MALASLSGFGILSFACGCVLSHGTAVHARIACCSTVPLGRQDCCNPVPSLSELLPQSICADASGNSTASYPAGHCSPGSSPSPDKPLNPLRKSATWSPTPSAIAVVCQAARAAFHEAVLLFRFDWLCWHILNLHRV